MRLPEVSVEFSLPPDLPLVWTPSDAAGLNPHQIPPARCAKCYLWIRNTLRVAAHVGFFPGNQTPPGRAVGAPACIADAAPLRGFFTLGPHGTGGEMWWFDPSRLPKDQPDTTLLTVFWTVPSADEEDGLAIMRSVKPR